MSKSSISMMVNSQNEWELTGEPVKADGWYGMADGLHTISITTVGFIGEIIIEGSIEPNPTEKDWFKVDCVSLKSTGPESQLFTGTTGLNLLGSYVWLRARLSRKEHGENPGEEAMRGYGYVDRILINI